MLYIVARLTAVLIEGLALMLGAAWLLALAQGRSFGLQWRAVVVVWLAFVASLIVAVGAAVVLARDVSSRLIVFAVVILGIFIPFVMRSEAMKKLK